MRRSKRWAELKRSDDRGSASLELMTVGLVLLVPLVYLVLAVASIQSGAFAAEGAARQAARVFVQSGTEKDAEASALRAVEFALADSGVDPQSIDIGVTCSPQPDQCLTRQGLVTVTIDIAVALPLAPAAITGDLPLAVPLHATSTQQVSRFWAAG